MNPKMAPRIATPRPARFTSQLMYDMQLLLSLTICLVSQELRSFASGDASQAGTALPEPGPTSATIVLQPGLRGNARRVTCESTASQLGSSWVGIRRVGRCGGVSHVLESRAGAALLARSVTSGCEFNH